MLIKNGYVVDPASGLSDYADLLIEDGRVVKVIKKGETTGCCQTSTCPDDVVDATGMTVMPGFIDLHVHFREPGFEYKETVKTGSRAAAAGGYTTVCPMPNTKPAIDSPEMVEKFLEIVKRDAIVNVLPVGTVTKGQQGAELADIAGMKKAGICAISEDGKSVMNAQIYREGMKLAKDNDVIVFAHCEDINLVNGGVMNAGKRAEELGLPGITNAVEDVITARDIFLSKETGAQLHLCHCSTEDSVKLVKLAKDMGLKVTAEVCPHHFAMADDEIPSDDANYKMNPPLRGRADVEALIKGLADGTMEIISTDHAPHGFEEKNGSMKGAPFGIVGLETSFALSYTKLVKSGFIKLEKLVELMSVNPARVLGIEKGTLKEGACADIAIVKLDEEYEINPDEFESKGKNTPFAGHKVSGRVMYTLVDGKVVYKRTK